MSKKNSWKNVIEKKKKEETTLDFANITPLEDRGFYKGTGDATLTDPDFYKGAGDIWSDGAIESPFTPFVKEEDADSLLQTLMGKSKRQATPSELGEQVIVEWLYNVGGISKEQVEEERNAFAKKFSNAGVQSDVANNNTATATNAGATAQPQRNKTSLWNMMYEDLHPEYSFGSSMQKGRTAWDELKDMGNYLENTIGNFDYADLYPEHALMDEALTAAKEKEEERFEQAQADIQMRYPTTTTEAEECGYAYIGDNIWYNEATGETLVQAGDNVMNIKAGSIPNANFIGLDGDSAMYYSPNQLGQMHIMQERDAANRDGMVQMVAQNGANANERHTATQANINNSVGEIASTYFLTPGQVEAAKRHKGTEFGLDTADVATGYPGLSYPATTLAGGAFTYRDMYDLEKQLVEAGYSDEEIVAKLRFELANDMGNEGISFSMERLPYGSPLKMIYDVAKYPQEISEYLNKWFGDPKLERLLEENTYGLTLEEILAYEYTKKK